MTYDPNIPLPTDILSQSQQDILDNFGAANTIFSKNHVTFNDAAATNRGKHNLVEFVLQPADPVIVATEGELFTKNDVNTIPQLFWKRFGGNAVQMTSVDPVSNVSGYTFLPGGLIFQWGSASSAGGISALIPFTISFSNPGYFVQLTPIRSGAPGVVQTFGVSTGTISATNFKVVTDSSAALHSFYWMAIGPA